MRRRSLLPTLAALVALAAPVGAQQAAPPAADPADVESIDAIMAAIYDVISGPAGEARDWDRFRSLFIPGARLIPSGRPQAGGPYRTRVMTPEEYVESSGPVLERDGFFENEIGRVVERFGPVVHLMSAYESLRNEDDPEPFVRGVNSFQLLDDGERWWIVSIFWTSETSELPIPQRLLGGGM